MMTMMRKKKKKKKRRRIEAMNLIQKKIYPSFKTWKKTVPPIQAGLKPTPGHPATINRKKKENAPLCAYKPS